MFNFRWQWNKGKPHSGKKEAYEGLSQEEQEVASHIQGLMFQGLMAENKDDCKAFMYRAIEGWSCASLDQSYVEIIFNKAFNQWIEYIESPDQKDYRYRIAIQVLSDTFQERE